MDRDDFKPARAMRKVDDTKSKFSHHAGRSEHTNGVHNVAVNVLVTDDGYGDGPGNVTEVEIEDELEVVCGPLLNYKRMSNTQSEFPTWHGSVMIITKPEQRQPELRLQRVGIVASTNHHGTEYSSNRTKGILTNGNNGLSANPTNQERSFRAVKLYANPGHAFWRFEIDVELEKYETRWQYTIPSVRFLSKSHQSRSFVVPAASQSMRIMFHSCNGFSVGTDEDAWSGPALWADVIRMHEQKPFHVMIGGGDQIYNDGVRVEGPLKAWTSIKNPIKRRHHLFGEELRRDCDKYYLDNYVRWFSMDDFAKANGQIPQINIWDDHDIIDGFGSYTDKFMQCSVFRGIGGVAFKYYCLFQHHIPPPKSSFTTDVLGTMHSEGVGGPGTDPEQLKDTFVLSEEPDPSFIIGNKPGPYVEEHSRNLYMRLGARIALVGIDARTERTRHQVNYPETYDLVFNRVKMELSASSGTIKHLIVLLGIPVAYPRLDWLENLFRSPLIAPMRLLNKRFGFGGNFFNQFDGQVDLLDDLDDHYTARAHKNERKELVLTLQSIAQEHGVRITMLGGDVHLAAMGRFYSNPKLRIPVEKDYRYMANIISSAITNKPPPGMVANLLARRNIIHHLDHSTDETLLGLFDKDPGGVYKRANWNHVTMPSRNYAIITEAEGQPVPHGINSNALPTAYSSEKTRGLNGVNGVHTTSNGVQASDQTTKKDAESLSLQKFPKDGHSPLHAGEATAGTQHAAADGLHGGDFPGGLDVTIRVEIDQHDNEGRTEGYGLSIPALVDPENKSMLPLGLKKKDSSVRVG